MIEMILNQIIIRSFAVQYNQLISINTKNSNNKSNNNIINNNSNQKEKVFNSTDLIQMIQMIQMICKIQAAMQPMNPIIMMVQI